MYIRIYTHCQATIILINLLIQCSTHVKTRENRPSPHRRGCPNQTWNWFHSPILVFQNQSAKDEERYSKIFLPTSVKVESTPASEENYNFIINIPVCFCLFVTIAWWKMYFAVSSLCWNHGLLVHSCTTAARSHWWTSSSLPSDKTFAT